MEEYGSILHAKWTSGGEAGSIIYGEWAEDGSRYEIRVPPQLRDKIVAMQNALSEQYQMIDNLRRQVTKREAAMATLLGQKGGAA
jgi:1,6-anhydro-N-acetylmuramate kinase